MTKEQYQKEVIQKLKGLVYELPDSIPSDDSIPCNRGWFHTMILLIDSQVQKLEKESK